MWKFGEGELGMRVGNAKANNTSLSSMSLSSMREQAEPRGLAGRHVVALGLAIVSFTASERAAADCTPESPRDNTTVTCTGTTTNQNSPDGYGTSNDTGNTIKVETGASVTGD